MVFDVLGVVTDETTASPALGLKSANVIAKDCLVEVQQTVWHHDTVAFAHELVSDNRTFVPWSDGPQGCVGKKFSQVEGAAILACLFKSHRLRLKTKAGEREEEVRKMARDCADDVNYQLMLKMNHIDVKLECLKR